MFKFDPLQALTHKPLGGNDKSNVYPYMEDLDESKWVVKCLHIKNYEELSYTSQNIQITSTAGSENVVPIKGHEIQKDRLGDTVIYIKMPRMQTSLQDIIQQSQYSNEGPIPIEQIVQYYYSILSCLYELFRKGIAHRNLKPTNIFTDAEGHIYLSDLKMAQSSTKDKQTDIEMRPISHEDWCYKAPETFLDNWVPNEGDLHKSDVWSLGMVIVQLCLLDNFIPISPDLPIGDTKEIVERNIMLVKQRYGADLAGTLEGSLAMDLNERPSLRTIQSSLQEVFPGLKLGQLKDIDIQSQSQIEWSNEIVGLMQHDVSLDMKEESSSKEKSSLIKGDISSIDKWIGSQNNSFIQFNVAPKLSNGFRKSKEFVKAHKRWTIAISALVILLIIVSMPLLEYLRFENRPKKFEEIMRGIQFKYRDHFHIDYNQFGMLNVEGVLNNPYDQNFTSNDTIIGNLMDDIAIQLESNNTHDHLQEFRFFFYGGSNITDESLYNMQASLVRMKGLRRLAIEQLNGPGISHRSLQSFFSNVSFQSIELHDLTIGLLDYPNIYTGTGGTHKIVKNALRYGRNLTTLNLFLDSTNLKDDDLEDLAEGLSEYGQNLDTLAIRIKPGLMNWNLSRISSTGLEDFNYLSFANLTNLRNLDLNFNGSPATDDVLEAIATSITSNARNLQTFNLTVSECNITDSGLKSFGSQLSKQKLEDLLVLNVQMPPMFYFSNETRASLLNQLKYIPEVRIWP